MSPLEIVLVSVLGAIVLIGVFYVLVFNTNKNNRLETFKVVNEDVKEGAIVFFGDSLTEFYPIQDFFPTYTIYNRGIAGDTTKDLLARIDNVIAVKPRKVFVQIGTNDLGKGATPKKVVANIKIIYQKLTEAIPGVEIIAISLYPISHHKMWLSPIIAGIRSNKKIRTTNFLLNELCREMNITFINMHDKLVGPRKRINKEYTLEGLHISGRGYGVISQVLCDYVKK